MSPTRLHRAYSAAAVKAERQSPPLLGLQLETVPGPLAASYQPAIGFPPHLSASASPTELSPASRAGSLSSVEEASVGLADVSQTFFGPSSAPTYPMASYSAANSLGLYPDTFVTLGSNAASSAFGIGYSYSDSHPAVFYIPDVDSASWSNAQVHASDLSYQQCHRSPLRASFEVVSPCAPTMELLGHYPFPSLMSATADMAISTAPSTASSSFADLRELNDSEAQLHGHGPNPMPMALAPSSRRPMNVKSASSGSAGDWGGANEKAGPWQSPSNETIKSRNGNSNAFQHGANRGASRPAEVESPDGDGRKRLRTLQACEKCRVRKAKCNGARPCCGRCETRGLDCYYAPERRMRGPNKRSKEELRRTADANASRRSQPVFTTPAIKAELSDESSSDELEPEDDHDGDYTPQQQAQMSAPPISQSSASATSMIIGGSAGPGPGAGAGAHSYLPSAYAPKVSASRQPLSQSPPVPPSPYLPFHLSPPMSQPTAFADVSVPGPVPMPHSPYPPVHPHAAGMGLGMTFSDAGAGAGPFSPRPPLIRHSHSSSSSSSVSLAPMLSPGLLPDGSSYHPYGQHVYPQQYFPTLNQAVHPHPYAGAYHPQRYDMMEMETQHGHGGGWDGYQPGMEQ